MVVHRLPYGLGTFYERYLMYISQVPVRWGSCGQHSRKYITGTYIIPYVMMSYTFHLHLVSVGLLLLEDPYPHIKYLTKIEQGFQMFLITYHM